MSTSSSRNGGRTLFAIKSFAQREGFLVSRSKTGFLPLQISSLSSLNDCFMKNLPPDKNINYENILAFEKKSCMDIYNEVNHKKV